MKRKCNFCGTIVDSKDNAKGFYEVFDRVLYVFCPTCGEVMMPIVDAINRKIHDIYLSNPVLREKLTHILNRIPHYESPRYSEEDATVLSVIIDDCGEKREVTRVICPGCLGHRQEGVTEEKGNPLDCKNTWQKDGKTVQCCCFSGAHGYRK